MTSHPVGKASKVVSQDDVQLRINCVRYEQLITTIGALFIATSLVQIVLFGLVVYVYFGGLPTKYRPPRIIGDAIFWFGVLAVPQLLTGIGVLRYSKWCRIPAAIFLAVVCGTSFTVVATYPNLSFLNATLALIGAICLPFLYVLLDVDIGYRIMTREYRQLIRSTPHLSRPIHHLWIVIVVVIITAFCSAMYFGDGGW